MGKPMSAGLSERVVVVDGGMSRRKAAERFGSSISSAIRWTSRVRRNGSVRPDPQGGDKRSARVEAQAPVFLAALEETPDITLAVLRALLAGQGMVVPPLHSGASSRGGRSRAKKDGLRLRADRPDVLSRRRT